MNCQFCYTGRMGLLGNLTTAQIVEQVVEARRFLAQEGTFGPDRAGQMPGAESPPVVIESGPGGDWVIPAECPSTPAQSVCWTCCAGLEPGR